jgi:hypothetical protein
MALPAFFLLSGTAFHLENSGNLLIKDNVLLYGNYGSGEI